MLHLKHLHFLFISSVACLLLSCQHEEQKTLSGLQKADFQTTIDSQDIDLFVLRNENGMEACVTNYGGRLVSLMVPDKDGVFEDVVAGYPTIAQYLAKRQNFGATIGRYIGRILNSTFNLDSITYQLVPNTAGIHCAHGGTPGFAEKIWTAEQLDARTLKLSLVSPDGENGFPGNLAVDLIYKLTPDNALDITYTATTDKPTVVNLSHHSFFNISGDFNTTVEDQLLYINSSSYTPYDSLKCVTGEIVTIEDTPFDFRASRLIGERHDEDCLQLNITGGYDHNWVLDTNGDENVLAAELIDPKSGRTMQIYTNEPGLQVYTANGLRGAMVGKDSIAYLKRSSVCLETQHYPDSPNKPQFPSTALRPGETYYSRCVYQFGIQPDAVK